MRRQSYSHRSYKKYPNRNSYFFDETNQRYYQEKDRDKVPRKESSLTPLLLNPFRNTESYRQDILQCLFDNKQMYDKSTDSSALYSFQDDNKIVVITSSCIEIYKINEAKQLSHMQTARINGKIAFASHSDGLNFSMLIFKEEGMNVNKYLSEYIDGSEVRKNKVNFNVNCIERFNDTTIICEKNRVIINDQQFVVKGKIVHIEYPYLMTTCGVIWMFKEKERSYEIEQFINLHSTVKKFFVRTDDIICILSDKVSIINKETKSIFDVPLSIKEITFSNDFVLMTNDKDYYVYNYECNDLIYHGWLDEEITNSLILDESINSLHTISDFILFTQKHMYYIG